MAAAATVARSSAHTGENIAWVALLVISLIVVLAGIVVALRIYTRSHIINNLDWDDYCVVLTLSVVTTNAALVLSCVRFGLGRHTAELGPVQITSYRRYFWMSVILYTIALGLVKLTFILQYYRAFPIHSMRKAIWILGSIIMAWSVVPFLIAIFSCRPLQKIWEPATPGHCTPHFPSWYISGSVNIAADLAITIMPLSALKSLQLKNRKQTYMLMGIFSLGFFTCAISIIRLRYLRRGTDFTYTDVTTACWSMAEVCCGIICACLPTLRPLVVKHKPAWILPLSSRCKRELHHHRRHHSYSHSHHHHHHRISNCTHGSTLVPTIDSRSVRNDSGATAVEDSMLAQKMLGRSSQRGEEDEKGGDLEMRRWEMDSFYSSTYVPSRSWAAMLDRAEDDDGQGGGARHNRASIIQEPPRAKLGFVTQVVGGEAADWHARPWTLLKDREPTASGITVKREVMVTKWGSNEE